MVVLFVCCHVAILHFTSGPLSKWRQCHSDLSSPHVCHGGGNINCQSNDAVHNIHTQFYVGRSAGSEFGRVLSGLVRPKREVNWLWKQRRDGFFIFWSLPVCDSASCITPVLHWTLPLDSLLPKNTVSIAAVIWPRLIWQDELSL